jgi:hypothetical protein
MRPQQQEYLLRLYHLNQTKKRHTSQRIHTRRIQSQSYPPSPRKVRVNLGRQKPIHPPTKRKKHDQRPLYMQHLLEDQQYTHNHHDADNLHACPNHN